MPAWVGLQALELLGFVDVHCLIIDLHVCSCVCAQVHELLLHCSGLHHHQRGGAGQVQHPQCPAAHCAADQLQRYYSLPAGPALLQGGKGPAILLRGQGLQDHLFWVWGKQNVVCSQAVCRMVLRAIVMSMHS